MADAYTPEDLGKTLDKLDAQLAKSAPPTEETTASLLKGLLDVATGAIALATGKRRKKKDGEVLAKAERSEKEDSEEEDDDDKKKELPPWLKDKVHDGKAAGEQIYAYDRDDTMKHELTNAGGESRQMGKNIGLMKSVQIGDTEVIDVGDHLARTEAQQQAMAKSLDELASLHKAVLNGLIAMDERLTALEAGAQEQARFTGVCAKGLGHLIEQQEQALTAPVGTSRYAVMEKGIAAAQRQLDADGGVVFKLNGPQSAMNRELLTKAVQTGKITMEQMTFIKRTERLPAGLTLS